MAFVALIDVVKHFGRHASVDCFSLKVEEGEFVSFLGGSGCGKTTTLRMIAGFEPPTSGRIHIKGSDVVQVPPNKRVALARALAVEPGVLLLDEPLSALDAKIRVRLRAEIRAIQRELGITTIDVTHDHEEALSSSDRIVVMKEGRIEQVGTPFEIYNRPASAFATSFIGSTNVLHATIVDPAKGSVVFDGQEIVAAGPLPGSAGQDVHLTLRPESITLNNGTASNNHLAGILSNVIFLGSIVRLVVSTGKSELLIDTFNNPHLTLPALGESVTVGFSTDACVLLT